MKSNRKGTSVTQHKSKITQQDMHVTWGKMIITKRQKRYERQTCIRKQTTVSYFTDTKNIKEYRKKMIETNNKCMLK